jgi:hypothetical protein
MQEPGCPNGWCGTQNTNQWSGPGEEGYWLAPTGEKFPFDPKKPPCQDKEDTDRCAMWASRDECQANPKFMMQFCAKSCKACTLDDHDEL